MGDFRGGILHHPDDPVLPAVVAAQYSCLDVGPLLPAVIRRHPEMDAVRTATTLDGLVDRRIETGPFRLFQAVEHGLGP